MVEKNIAKGTIGNIKKVLREVINKSIHHKLGNMETDAELESSRKEQLDNDKYIDGILNGNILNRYKYVNMVKKRKYPEREDNSNKNNMSGLVAYRKVVGIKDVDMDEEMMYSSQTARKATRTFTTKKLK